MQIAPWHSPTGRMYHTETECHAARQVKEASRRPGPSDKFHCENCKRLARRRKLLLERAQRRASAQATE